MKVEVSNTNEGFKFRLVDGKRKSGWANYTQIAMLDGMAAITAYYSGSSDKELVPLPAAEILAEFAVCEEV